MISYSLIMVITIIPLLIYAFLLYLSENLILKYISKYSKYYSSWPEYYLLIYTAGIASGLQAFLPGLAVVLNGNPKLAYYFQLYNVVLDYTITLGTFILGFNFNEKLIDSNILAFITIALIAQIIVLIFKEINFWMGAILYIIFLLITIYIFYRYRKKDQTKVEYKDSFYEYFKALVFALEIALAVSIIYIGGNILNNIANTFQSLGLSIPLIGYVISLILFTLPDILYGHISWFKKKDLNISIASITGEELSELTLFIGIIAMINPIIFGPSDIIPIISSMSVMYLSILILYLFSYKGRIPRWIGIILIALGIILGFINGIANIS
jgi:Ca2+/Na+ antiporter